MTDTATKLSFGKKTRANQLPAGKKSRLPSIVEEGNKSGDSSKDRNTPVPDACLVHEIQQDEAPGTDIHLPDVTFEDCADYASSPCFSIHDNRYENSDVQNFEHGESQRGKYGDDQHPQGMVPHLPYTEYPNLTGTSRTANESIADIIARVTRKTIEDLRREGKSLSDIEDAATEAAKQSFQRHTPSSAAQSKPSDKPDDSEAEEHSEHSDETSYYSYSSDSSEGSEEKKPKKFRPCYVAKKTKINSDLRIFVINGHTGKDSRKPVTDIGELLLSLNKFFSL